MSDRCPVEWETWDDDEDGDGEAEHFCFLPEGHTHEWHFCAQHFACNPVCGEPSWFYDEPGAAEP